MNGSDRPAPQVETLLKRLIPILILAFLVVVAASRMLGIVAEYSRMEEAARHSTALTALTAKAALINNGIVFTGQDRTRAEASLVAALPSGSLADGTMVLLSGSNGRIFAGAGKEAMLYIGT
jgi:two-component system cell cycle sensor histidine kinase PleC